MSFTYSFNMNETNTLISLFPFIYFFLKILAFFFFFFLLFLSLFKLPGQMRKQLQDVGFKSVWLCQISLSFFFHCGLKHAKFKAKLLT